MGAVFWAVITCLILAIKFRKKVIERARLIYYLSYIPGPFSLPILGHTYMMKWKISALAVQTLDWVHYYMRQKVDLVCFWIGPCPFVAAFSVKSVKAILESNEVTAKGNEYDILARWLGTSLLTSSGEVWRKKRKLLTPAFHFKMLGQFHFVHDKESQVFLEQLEPFADTGEMFDLYPFLQRFALDVICETSMGIKVDAQLNHNHPYVIAVKKLSKLSFAYGRMPWLWFKPIWYLSGYQASYEKNLKLVTDFTKKVISQRQQEFDLNNKDDDAEPKQGVFLDLLLSFQQQGNFSETEIRDEVETFMYAGHDTTSTGIAWTLWSLAHNPDCQKRVIEEVDSIFGSSNRNCTIEDLKLMPYIEQCIKEGHRLFSPVPIVFRKVEKDFECAGKKIPPGTTIVIAPALVHISADHYTTPFSFNPEHFNKDNVSARHSFAYIPFSAGPRNCIGQKFALQEEKTLLSWFFRRYTIKPTIPFARNFPLPEIILKPSKGVPIKIERRTTNN